MTTKPSRHTTQGRGDSLNKEANKELLDRYRRNLRRRNPKLDATISSDGNITAIDEQGKQIVRWKLKK